MSNSYKRTVAIESIVSSDLNARRDFSDVAELAEAIRATGGQPVNPIAVRPMRDGTFRVIDGERRLRALRSIGAEMTDVVVYPETSDATEALAVLATDSKRRLDGTEVMRAYQQVLDLDVDDERVALAVGIDADVVRRTRRVPRKLITEQTTLDALIAAADDEFSEEERKTIISEGARTWGDPAAQADRIRKRHIKERAQGEARAALVEEFGEDVEFHEQPTSAWAAERDGLLYVGTVKDAKGSARIAKKLAGSVGLHAYPKATGVGFEVYRKRRDDEVSEEEVERARVEKRRDEHAEAYDRAFTEMCRFATEPWVKEDALERARILAGAARTPASRRPNLCTEIMADRLRDSGNYRHVFSSLGRRLLHAAATVAEDDDPSLLEVCRWLMDLHDIYGLLDYHGEDISKYSAKRFRRVYDALLLDGWKPDENAQALRALCPGDEKEDGNDDAE